MAGEPPSQNQPMILSLEQIKERLRSPKKKAAIDQAIKHQKRLRFHSETTLGKYYGTGDYALTEFLDWVKSATEMPEDKFSTFMYMMRWPVKTVKIVDKIYEDLAKVFDGQNPVYQFDFTSTEFLEDYMNYLTDIQFSNRWRSEGVMAMKLSINSILIVDYPQEQEGERPEPYSWLMDICNAIDYDEDEEELEMLIFRRDEKTAVVIDEESYRVLYYENDPDKAYIKETIPHDFGYCPAKFFWTDSISDRQKDIKLSPITTSLGDLDWLLYFMLAKQHLDTYAGYPIYSAFERDCDFEYEGERGYARCDRGFLKDMSGHYLLQGDKIATCPVCSQKRLRGPGTYYEVPKPGPENDNADMRNPISITTIDKDSLEYNVSEYQRLLKEIKENVVGYAHEPGNDQAKNVPQIMSYYEERTSVLRRIKRNFEAIMEWEAYTLAKGRYGDDFISCFIDLGTDFYLYESQYLLDLYHTARTAKADASTLDALQNQYLHARYRNSPDQLQKEIIITHIDPLRHITSDEAVVLHEKNLIGYHDLLMKLNLSTFVKKFERENAPLTKFGTALPFAERIARISQIIKSYVTRPTAQESFIPAAQPGTNTGATQGAA